MQLSQLMGEDSESLDKLFSCLSLSFLICEMGTIIYVGQLAKALWPYWIADCLHPTLAFFLVSLLQVVPCGGVPDGDLS